MPQYPPLKPVRQVCPFAPSQSEAAVHSAPTAKPKSGPSSPHAAMLEKRRRESKKRRREGGLEGERTFISISMRSPRGRRKRLFLLGNWSDRFAQKVVSSATSLDRKVVRDRRRNHHRNAHRFATKGRDMVAVINSSPHRVTKKSSETRSQ